MRLLRLHLARDGRTRSMHTHQHTAVTWCHVCMVMSCGRVCAWSCCRGGGPWTLVAVILIVFLWEGAASNQSVLAYTSQGQDDDLVCVSFATAQYYTLSLRPSYHVVCVFCVFVCAGVYASAADGPPRRRVGQRVLAKCEFLFFWWCGCPTWKRHI